MNGKSESESLRILLGEFLQKEHIKKTLRFLSENKIYGCEKWFQIEFMRFLFENENVVSDEICKEEECDYDKRKEFDYVKQRIDLTFRIKNKQYYHAIELKHKHCFSISSIEEDLAKLDRAKPSQKEYFRKIFSVLLHPFVGDDKIKNKLRRREFADKFEFSIKIPTANLSCSVFSAEI
ncbi:hypothetical protein EDC39_102203 [Geothermobacter ehrlichii]|uniref:PD-(D/E)XK nuclease superfamily protein n=1 Tax=Geothermobacter ehrlichii TaxID=213224 RepID=A0A5D3WNK5_9BACT|nr:hypothetical protein [Geothermobacter ehrlichii]TYO99678.1 hypothetical protein EDC39_102203 [Geothermobacter ehrlichii]